MIYKKLDIVVAILIICHFQICPKHNRAIVILNWWWRSAIHTIDHCSQHVTHVQWPNYWLPIKFQCQVNFLHIYSLCDPVEPSCLPLVKRYPIHLFLGHYFPIQRLPEWVNGDRSIKCASDPQIRSRAKKQLLAISYVQHFNSLLNTWFDRWGSTWCCA